MTQAGFGEHKEPLFSIDTDNQGGFTKTFPVLDDFGGIPHRINLQVNGQNYGQAYLSITPSIVKVQPVSAEATDELS